jgi:2,4-dienoyl-CoA reductase-like NADH-dependent reductase (Old Yellow Enzyme family)
MKTLFSEGKIGPVSIKNRITHSATYESMASDDGSVTQRLIGRVERLARGGVGLIIPGHMFIEPVGRAMTRQTSAHSDEMITGLTRLADAGKQNQARIFFQIAHAGRQTTKDVADAIPISPSSGRRDPALFVKPREMTEEDIRRVIQAFIAAAQRSYQAGADGVQIHAAHGYLINQFLSPFFNRRKDHWGGSEEGRFKFLEEIIKGINSIKPPHKALIIKLNTNDWTPAPGITPNLAGRYAGRLVALGIDAIEISGGTLSYSFMHTVRGEVPVDELVKNVSWWQKIPARVMLSSWRGKYDLTHGYHMEAAKIIKPFMGEVPLMVVGGMRNIDHMEAALNNGPADFISMSRPLIREPGLVNRLQSGETKEASCVSCNRCIGHMSEGKPLRCYYKTT